MIKKVRKSRISKEEILADFVFFFIPAFLSFLTIFFFDIHQSFYQAPYYPFTFILNDYWIYVGGTLLGGLIGFFLIKLFIFGVREERV